MIICAGGKVCIASTILLSVASSPKLEKYYNVKITVENPKVLNYRCTGKFKEQDGVEHILKVIQKDHPFTYSISEEGDSIRIE